jgi:hypothetical protein
MVAAVKQGEEFQWISHWQRNSFSWQLILTIQLHQTVSVAASNGMKVLTKTSIGQFDIIENQHLSLILLEDETEN